MLTYDRTMELSSSIIVGSCRSLNIAQLDCVVDLCCSRDYIRTERHEQIGDKIEMIEHELAV